MFTGLHVKTGNVDVWILCTIIMSGLHRWFSCCAMLGTASRPNTHVQSPLYLCCCALFLHGSLVRGAKPTSNSSFASLSKTIKSSESRQRWLAAMEAWRAARRHASSITLLSWHHINFWDRHKQSALEVGLACRQNRNLVGCQFGKIPGAHNMTVRQWLFLQHEIPRTASAIRQHKSHWGSWLSEVAVGVKITANNELLDKHKAVRLKWKTRQCIYIYQQNSHLLW